MSGGKPAAGAAALTRHELYELCVQSPDHLAPFLRAVHRDALGRSPDDTPARVLGEDFAGTAACSVAWVETDADARAIAVDLDAPTLAHRGEHDRIERVLGDALTATDAERHACDVVFVGNFSIGEIHRREALVGYLQGARARLEGAPFGGGVFVCDTYGGESAFLTGEVHRAHPVPREWSDRFGLPPGCIVRYTWEQRAADPMSGRVVDACHFRLERAGTVMDEFDDAFVYDWRLWSVPELRDALREAGFRDTLVYAKLPDAFDDEGHAYVQPVIDPDELDDSFIVCVCGVV